ncbi:MAG: ribosome small subunit-dependent GTPase A [Candidatus Neomarinimicrobiota bacterium]|jgi:ribosome biogenesis GTPase|nr:ribosome small subunit-dependent GTPase A [Candidatus Neomarinimicrobiota bacterium]MDX9779649.1 ribosome small subunit-dependent GTPase A [bacterium]
MKKQKLHIPREYAEIPLPAVAACVGRVIAEHRQRYNVQSEQGVYAAGVSGKMLFLADSGEALPAVGDWVVLIPSDSATAVIETVLPRKSALIRRLSGRTDSGQLIAANLNAAFIVMAGGEDFNINRMERYLSIIHEGGIKPYLVLNKSDLFDAETRKNYIAAIGERHPDLPLITLSAKSGEGVIDIIKTLIPGNTYCFLGSSGVGKSTLINLIAGEERLPTRPLSDASSKGVHTTTFRELVELNNGSYLIDTPGLREVGLTAADAGIEQTFGDIVAIAEHCRFRDCSHLNEPGCAVRAAISDGRLSPDKFENYLRLRKESEHYQMEDYRRRRQERQFTNILREYKRIKKKT